MSDSEIPFDVLADAAADGVILIDDQSTILFVNPAAGQIFGYEPAEMVGMNLTQLMPERHRQNYLASLKGYFETGQSHIPKGSAPLKGLHKSGHEFPVEVSWAEHTSHGKRFLTGFVRDVTDRKRMEQLRERRVRHAAMNQEIHAAFASRAHSGLQSILQASAEAVVHHLDAAFARIWMLNDRESQLELQASAGQYTRLNGEFARMQIGERHVGFVAQQRKPYIVHDLVNDARTEHREWAKKEGIIALAGYPLLVEGHLVGVLALFARRTLGSDTLEALASVADTVAQGAKRKQTEAKLVAHQRQLEEAQLLAHLGSWSWDLPTGALTWSEELYRIFGRDKDAFRPTHQAFLDFVHPNDRALFEGALDDCLKGHRPYDCEFRIVRPDRTARTLHSLGQVIFDEMGKPLRMTGMAQDITERKQAEEKLRESEERFRQLTENIGELFWLADAELQSIIYVSPAYETIWHRSCESLYAEPDAWLGAIHPEDRPRVLDARKVRTDAAYELEYRIVRPDGAIRWIRDQAFPVLDAAGRIIRMAGVAEDVTERRQLEMQLHQIQKMDAVGQLAAGVAHDFNNLLAVISGHSELLAMRSPLDDQWRDSIAEIRRATELGSTTIRQLLALSCQQILEPKILDLNAVVTDAEKMLRRLIGEDVRLATLLQPRISPVRADMGQLNQVILNLAVNARDAMPQGGSLTLETRELDLDAAYAEAHPEVRPGRYVLLTVTDTGWGMAPDVQARIFEPFFTNKAEGRGTGLGLAVVLGIVRQSGGHIDVESRPGVGTKFKIYLPTVHGPAEGSAQSAPPNLVGGSETVLLVEDEEPVRSVTTLLLEALGYRVLQAENGQDALRLFEASGEKIDLLMADVVMPDLSGREVAEALQAMDPHLKVLFQSGYTDDTVVRRGILRAEVAFLKKPFSLDDLARKVRETLDRPPNSSHLN